MMVATAIARVAGTGAAHVWHWCCGEHMGTHPLASNDGERPKCRTDREQARYNPVETLHDGGVLDGRIVQDREDVALCKREHRRLECHEASELVTHAVDRVYNLAGGYSSRDPLHQRPSACTVGRQSASASQPHEQAAAGGVMEATPIPSRDEGRATPMSAFLPPYMPLAPCPPFALSLRGRIMW
jgi:hypothetical protein